MAEGLADLFGPGVFTSTDDDGRLVISREVMALLEGMARAAGLTELWRDSASPPTVQGTELDLEPRRMPLYAGGHTAASDACAGFGPPEVYAGGLTDLIPRPRQETSVAPAGA
jgi:hypothetical protein